MSAPRCRCAGLVGHGQRLDHAGRAGSTRSRCRRGADECSRPRRALREHLARPVAATVGLGLSLGRRARAASSRAAAHLLRRFAAHGRRPRRRPPARGWAWASDSALRRSARSLMRAAAASASSSMHARLVVRLVPGARLHRRSPVGDQAEQRRRRSARWRGDRPRPDRSEAGRSDSGDHALDRRRARPEVGEGIGVPASPDRLGLRSGGSDQRRTSTVLFAHSVSSASPGQLGLGVLAGRESSRSASSRSPAYDVIGFGQPATRLASRRPPAAAPPLLRRPPSAHPRRPRP